MNRPLAYTLAAVVVGMQALVLYRLVVLDKTIKHGMKWLG